MYRFSMWDNIISKRKSTGIGVRKVTILTFELLNKKLYIPKSQSLDLWN